MKQCLLITGFIILSILTTFGQTPVSNADDSLKQILCRKWVISRITVAGQRINSDDLATTYEFKTDYSVVCVTEKGARKGVWSYDSVNHLVLVIFKKKDHVYVKSLTANEFELAEPNEDPNELLPLKVYFKPKQNAVHE